jgi:hypothetical protein
MPVMPPRPSSGPEESSFLNSTAAKYGVHSSDAFSQTAGVRLGSPAGIDLPNVHTSETFTSSPAVWMSKHLGAHASLSAKTFGTIAKLDVKEPVAAPHSDRGARFIVGES